jgi:hypothetical protein
MKSTSTAAMETLLNLTPLDLVIQAEAIMVLYRLHDSVGFGNSGGGEDGTL